MAILVDAVIGIETPVGGGVMELGSVGLEVLLSLFSGSDPAEAPNVKYTPRALLVS